MRHHAVVPCLGADCGMLPLFFLGFVQTLPGFVLNFMAYLPSFAVPSWPGDRGREGCH